MSRVLDRELRREWVHRILDHDGAAGEEGGIERWLVLTDALGLERDYVDFHAGCAAGDALRRRGLCHLRARAPAGGGGRLLADRAVRAADPSRAHRRHAGELRLHRRARRCSISAAASTRPIATPISRSTTSSGTPPRLRAGGGHRGGALQVQRAVGAARRPASRLCRRRARSRPAPSVRSAT